MRLFIQFRINSIRQMLQEHPSLTVKEVAYRLKIPSQTVYKMIERTHLDRRTKDRTTDARRKTPADSLKNPLVRLLFSL